MNRPMPSRPHELALPVASLSALRYSLVQAVGDDDAAHALRAAGYAAGDALFSTLAAGELDGNMAAARFWQRLEQLFASRGWGHLRHENLHDGVGALVATDWVEAESDAPAQRPSCFLSTGLFANLLGRAAGADVSVLEVECRARGDRHCRFLFGSPEALDAVYAHVADGQSAEESLAALG